MPFHPAAQQTIRKVEALSGRLVHLREDPELKVWREFAKPLLADQRLG